jgi:hypothetical protein
MRIREESRPVVAERPAELLPPSERAVLHNDCESYLRAGSSSGLSETFVLCRLGSSIEGAQLGGSSMDGVLLGREEAQGNLRVRLFPVSEGWRGFPPPLIEYTLSVEAEGSRLVGEWRSLMCANRGTIELVRADSPWLGSTPYRGSLHDVIGAMGE